MITMHALHEKYQADLDTRIDGLGQLASDPTREKQTCEESRHVFWGSLAATAASEKPWTEDALDRLDEAFSLAVVGTQNHYQINILDRWIDIKVLRARGFFSQLSDARLLYFHVLLRGYRREFQRVSRAAADRGLGRDKLSEFGRIAGDVFDVLRLHHHPDATSVSSVRDIAARIRDRLAGLAQVAGQAVYSEDELVSRADESCQAIEELFQQLGNYLKLPAQRPQEAVTWWNELLAAAQTSARFTHPPRPNFPQAPALLESIFEGRVDVPLPSRDVFEPVRSQLFSADRRRLLKREDPRDFDKDEWSTFVVEPAPFVVQCNEAFRRDLPNLLETDRGKFVAYAGDKRLDIDENESYLRERLTNAGRIAIYYVEPQDEELAAPLW